MKITTRRAVISDTHKLIDLLYQVEGIHHTGRPDLFRPHGTKYTEEEIHSIIENDTTPVFVAETDGNVVGYIFCIISEYKGNTIFFDMKNLHMEDICVDSACRGMGIGGIMMDYVMGWAKNNGVTHVDLDVWEFNEGARRFYEKYGFATQKRRMDKWL